MQPCPSCGFSQNRDNARFCSNCAAPLAAPTAIACARCGAQNLPSARFCANCASPLTSAQLAMTGLLAPNALLESRYVITRKLGQGGMGAVYQAQDARLQGKLWAIKEMSNTQTADPAERTNAIAAFQREAQLLATLDHANLPKVTDFFAADGKQYLVMDFVDGQTLEQVVAATPGFLPEPTVLAWAEQLCDVLEYLHTRQPPIVFRDLKPANIMLTREGKIKLIDFGIARLFNAGKTKDTAAYGTMGYAAPEQFGTGQTDARSDIYSLGVTLHFLLTKYDPALSPFNLPPIRNVNPIASPQTEAVIVRATKSGALERFQSMKELKQSLYQTSKHAMPFGQPQSSTAQSSSPAQPSPGSKQFRVVLEVSPIVLNFGKINQPTTKKFQVRVNWAQTLLKGRVSVESSWVKLSPKTFRGNDVYISVSVDPTKFPKINPLFLRNAPQEFTTKIEVESNAGNKTVDVIFSPIYDLP